MKALRERIKDGEILSGGTATEYFRPSVVKAFANAGLSRAGNRSVMAEKRMTGNAPVPFRSGPQL